MKIINNIPYLLAGILTGYLISNYIGKSQPNPEIALLSFAVAMLLLFFGLWFMMRNF
jgi:hypothetical protein